MSSNILIKKICVYCNQEFDAQTVKTRYCSHICNRKDYKLKSKEKKILESSGAKLLMMSKEKEPVKELDFLTVKEASLLLKISIKTLYRLIDQNEINAINFTERNTLIRRKDIDAYFDNQLISTNRDRSYLLKEINPKNSYTMQEAQEKFKISNGALYNLIKKFTIPKKKQGRFTLVKKEHLDKILT